MFFHEKVDMSCKYEKKCLFLNFESSFVYL